MNTPRQAGLLQICPHDSAPFGDLLQVYQQAAQAANLQCRTIVLSSPSGQPLPNCEYLGLSNLSQTGKLKRLLRNWVRADWDLVLCHRYRAYLGAVKAGVDKQRCVTLAHEFGFFNKWRRRLNRQLFASEVHFAGVSRPVSEELAHITGHSMILPNALDAESVRKQALSRDNALRGLGLAAGGFTIGVVGRLHYKKRPELAYQAYLSFKQRNPRARLVFVGEGELSTQLKQFNDPDVFFTGQVEDARRYFKAFDALLYPAVADSFGMVPLEAMNLGVPVVCLKKHGPAYVLGPLGYYAQEDSAAGYATALQQVLGADTHELAKLGAERVEQHFSISAVTRTLDHLLIEMTQA